MARPVRRLARLPVARSVARLPLPVFAQCRDKMSRRETSTRSFRSLLQTPHTRMSIPRTFRLERFGARSLTATGTKRSARSPSLDGPLRRAVFLFARFLLKPRSDHPGRTGSIRAQFTFAQSTTNFFVCSVMESVTDLKIGAGEAPV